MSSADNISDIRMYHTNTLLNMLFSQSSCYHSKARAINKKHMALLGA